MTKYTDQGVIEVSIPPEVAAQIDDIVAVRQLPATLTPMGNIRASAQEHFGANVVLHPSAARTASGATALFDVEDFICAASCFNVTAISGMASCDIFLEGIFETSGIAHRLHHHNFTATGSSSITVDPLAFRFVRVRWAIITPGVAPSITFIAEIQGKA